MNLFLFELKDDFKYVYDQKEYLNKPTMDEAWIFMGEEKKTTPAVPKIEELSLKEQAKVIKPLELS